MLHRPSDWVGPEYGVDRASIWLAWSDDLRSWDYGEPGENVVLEPEAPWEGAKVGGGPPPIRTDAGWLMLYHGVDERYVYRVGAALLDLEDPRRVLGRTREFLMEPQAGWEREGIIPNVVFPTAALAEPDGRLLVYYGGADRVVGLATGRVDELVDHLLG
jgi:predicted GH43/DUF377 family glycosyl hydrolase